MSAIPDLPQGITQNTISFLLGLPAPEALRIPEFQQSAHDIITHLPNSQALQYGPEQGYPGLITVLQEKINREQQLSLRLENLMTTVGSTGAVDMIARLFTRPGSIVLVEAPSYRDALHVFRDHGCDLHSIPIDQDGIITTQLENHLESLSRQGKSPALFYTVPNFHNPAGITTSLQRRQEVVALAHRYGFIIVEDDVYRDLIFEGSLPPSYYALADGQQVVSVGSFSKTLAPGLRLGWFASAPEIIERCSNAGTIQMSGGANPLAAQIVAEYCQNGHWESHITHLRQFYRERRDLMLSALGRSMPPAVTWTHPAGGFFIWLTLPEGLTGQVVKSAALERGLAIGVGDTFFVNPADGSRHIRLAYSYAPLAEIEIGVKILGNVLRNLMA